MKTTRRGFLKKMGAMVGGFAAAMVTVGKVSAAPIVKVDEIDVEFGTKVCRPDAKIIIESNPRGPNDDYFREEYLRASAKALSNKIDRDIISVYEGWS